VLIFFRGPFFAHLPFAFSPAFLPDFFLFFFSASA
jgi:hypothetical protein